MLPRNPLVYSVWILTASWSSFAWAGYKDDIGFNQLATELGGSMPTGAGVSVSQVEAASGGFSLPDTSDGQFSGKSFTVKGTASGVSSHATTVAQHFYGSSTSLAPGISTIDLYEANNWLSSAFLKLGGVNPLAETRDVANFSWVGTSADAPTDQEIIRRFDYSIQQSNYVAVVGTNNGTSASVPQLLCHNYNGITVGKTDGAHAAGLTTADAAGRMKPDIVAPPSAGNNFTSFTTALVSGAAAQLIEKARGTGGLANGADSRSVKAILLAGATTAEFPGWSRSSTHPLDSVYGAGELNVYNSYHILTAGEQSASESRTVATKGFALATANGSNQHYYFDVPAGMVLNNFSTILTWNRVITDSNPGVGFTPVAALDNLNLKLFVAPSGYTLGTQLDSSVSSVDNVEHIFQGSLSEGRYAIEVDYGSTSTDYALAWTGDLAAVPELSSVWLLVAGGALLGASRRRWSVLW
jgi:hypothetical protein